MKRSNRLPWAVAVLTSLAAWGIAALVLGGISVGKQTSFIIFGSLFAGALAFFVAQRLLHGPELERDEWILMRESPEPPEPPHVPSVEALRARLANYGYRVHLTGDVLWQHKVTLTAEDIGLGELRCELGNAAPPFFGTIEIDDNPKATYATLATCVIFELGELVPGLLHKRTYSTLPAESTTSLQPLLPDGKSATGTARGA